MTDALQYLEAVIPPGGLRVVAYRPPEWSDDIKGIKHAFLESNEAVVRTVQSLEARNIQSWIALASFADKEGGRKIINTVALQVLWMDIDYKNYDTPGHAQDDARRMTAEIGEPSLIVQSGGGMHVYWVLRVALPTATWKPLADAFQGLWQRLGIKADPISGDAARVLRMPGTFNRKADYAEPREVTLQHINDLTYDPVSLARKLGAAAAKPAMPAFAVAIPHAARHANDDLSGGMEHRVSFIQPMLQKCNQLRENFANRATMQEPLWYATLGLVRHVEDGRRVAHVFSNTHPGYSQEETDAKLAQLEPIGPTTCTKFKQTNPSGCAGCKFNVTTPLQLGYADTPEIVSVQPTIDIERREVTASGEVEVTHRIERPDVSIPDGFSYDGEVIFRRVKDEESGAWINEAVFRGFLCPERLVTNERLNHATEVQMYVHANGQPPKRMTLPGKAFSDKKDLARELSGKGVFSMVKNSNHILDMLQRMVQEVQSKKRDSAVAEQMGWQEDGMFVVGSTGFRLNQPPQYDLPVPAGTKSVVHNYQPEGSLSVWKETADIYNRPGAEAYQFALCYGAAGVFLPMTKLSGVVLSLYSQSAGRGKSTAGFAALSWWGNPDGMKSQSKDTNNALFGKASRHKNLPILMDEITDKPARELEDLVYFMTQGREKESMTSERVARPVLPGWALPVISTSNNSIRSKLMSQRGDAQGLFARIVEVPMDLQFAQEMGYTDRMKLRSGFVENYGQAGPILIKFAMENQGMCQGVMDAITAKLDAAVKGDSAYRFWVASAASALTVAHCAKTLGLLNFDVAKLAQWTMDLLRSQRVDAITNLASSEDVLAQFLELNNNRILVSYMRTIAVGAQAPAVWPEEGVHGPMLVGRAELPERSLYVSVPAFSRFCHEAGFDMASFIRNASSMTEAVSGEPLLKRPQPVVVNLGRGTKGASARTKTLEFNLMHPALREFAMGIDSKIEPIQLRSVK